MSCSLDRILNNDSFCEYKDKTNATIAVVEDICNKGIRLSVKGTTSDNNSIFNEVKLITFSGTPTDPLNGFSAISKYTVQPNDSGFFEIFVSSGLIFQTTGNTFFELALLKNGNPEFFTSLAGVNNEVQWRPFISKILQLNAGDYIEFFHNTIGATGSAGSAVGIQNVFEIRKI